MPLTVEQLIEDSGESLELSLVAGADGTGRVIRNPRIQKPGLALTGYEEQLDNERLLTFGGTEIDYLSGTSPTERELGIRTVMGSSPACIVVTRKLTPPDELIAACNQEGVPLLVSGLVSARFIAKIKSYLRGKLSPGKTEHGVVVEVHGVGVLLLGKSGIGKSEAALDLVLRGHRLVVDDVVRLSREGPSLVTASGNELLGHHMEIRGLGIIDVEALFGVSCVRESVRVELVIELCEWSEDLPDRLGLDDEYHSILGEEIPMLRVPVRPGRNIASIIEVAARNHTLKSMGRHSAREFTERLRVAREQAAAEVASAGDAT